MAQDATVHVRTAAYPAGTPLSGVYVGLYDDNSVFITSGVTSAGPVPPAGEVIFPALTAGDYELRINPNSPGAIVTLGAVQQVTVEDPVVTTNTFDIAVNTATMPTSSDATLCRCSGYFVDPTGEPVANVSLYFGESHLPQLTYQAGTDVMSGVLPFRKIAKTDDDGYVVVDLIRDAEYSVIMPSYENMVRMIMVPTTASASLPDMMFPTVGHVEYSVASVPILPISGPSISLTVGQVVEVDIATYLRSGVLTANALVSCESSDDAVFTAQPSSGGVTLTGIAVGTGELELTRTAPDGGAGISSYPTPNVVANLDVEVV